MKNALIAMSDGVANSAVVTVSVGMLLELDFYMVNTVKQSDSYTKQKHSPNTARPNKN